MVTVGVLVRVENESLRDVELALNAIPGVSTLELEEAGSIGLVIEAPDLDAAHSLLCDQVQRTAGVLAAWPIHTQLETQPPDASSQPFQFRS